MAQFLTAKGLVYAFTPSLTTLRHLAAGDPLPPNRRAPPSGSSGIPPPLT
ncbi:hypothetical protein JCM4914_73760 [Streptomyces platensis subsp. malvinus]